MKFLPLGLFLKFFLHNVLKHFTTFMHLLEAWCIKFVRGAGVGRQWWWHLSAQPVTSSNQSPEWGGLIGGRAGQGEVGGGNWLPVSVGWGQQGLGRSRKRKAMGGILPVFVAHCSDWWSAYWLPLALKSGTWPQGIGRHGGHVAPAVAQGGRAHSLPAHPWVMAPGHGSVCG